MRIPLFIPFLNRPDLLAKAVESTRGSKLVDVTIIDNSDIVIADAYYPPVSLTFSQSQNWMRRIARKRGAEFYFWIHSDAETSPEDLEKLANMARTETRNWGVIFTYYDTLCAYKTEAMEAIGGYDTNFRDYFSDNDVYRRLKLAGYELLESHIQTKHVGSQTLNSDPRMQFIHHNHHFPQARELYKLKWGGEPGKEKFTVPYNGMADRGV
jgi:hypothetical protein